MHPGPSPLAQTELTAAGKYSGGSAEGSYDFSEEEGLSQFFPLHLFTCCSPTVQFLFPSTYAKIQSPIHLTLVIGSLASAIMLVKTLYSAYRYGCTNSLCHSVFVMFAIVSGHYFVQTIKQYDECLIKKQKELKKGVQKLERTYQETTEDMDHCLARAVTSTVELAEQSFEAKQRLFARFIMRFGMRLEKTGLTGVPLDRLFNELRTFLLHWFDVFAECSIDPIDAPNRVFDDPTLKSCCSNAELADYVKDKLDVVEVRFVSKQRELDSNEISKGRELWQSIKRSHAVRMFKRGTKEQETEQTLKMESGVYDEDDGHTAWADACISLSPTCQFGWEKNEDSRDGFPYHLRFACFSFVFLSPAHVEIILGAFIGLCLLVREAPSRNFAVISNIVICLICLLCVLLDFSNIDAVRRLEQELEELKYAEVRLEHKRQRIISFFETTHKLADLWLHRTVPRLELMGQFHNHVEDAELKDIPDLLSSINESFKPLNDSLPPLSLWKGETVLSVSRKKQYGKKLMDLAELGYIDAILKKMPEIIREFEAEAAQVAAGQKTKDLSALIEEAPTKR